MAVSYSVAFIHGSATAAIAPMCFIPIIRSQLPFGSINPFAAFSLANIDPADENVKQLFISTAIRISDRVKLLLEDSFDLSHNKDVIQETLDRIKELALGEVGNLPRLHVLGALWARLVRADDYEQHKPHTSLLTDMIDFYESSSKVMKETIVALSHVEAELGEFCDDFAAPGLILKDDPLEVIIALLRKSAQRLEVGKMKLEHIEEGKRPRKKIIPRTGSMGIVTVTTTVT